MIEPSPSPTPSSGQPEAHDIAAVTDAVQQLFGPPFLTDRRGRFVLNPNFWTEAFVQQFGIQYELSLRSFVDQHDRVPVQNAELMSRMTQVLQGAAAPLGADLAPGQISVKAVRRLMTAMEARAAVQSTGPAEVVDGFLADALEPHGEAKLLSQDGLNALVKHCAAQALPLLSKALFFRMLSRRLGKPSHGKARSYSGWRLKPEFACEPVSPTDPQPSNA
jgi:hypothetical protein